MTAPAPNTPARRGILAGGNWVTDHIKLLDTWPEQDALATVLSHSLGSGGAPYNVLKDLAHLQVPYPLEAAGLLGLDQEGAAILADCAKEGINTRQLHQTTEAHTSYTDVMTVRETGRRTFFYHKGTNALLGPGHFDFAASGARHFHLGYLLLLDRLDQIEGDTTVSAMLLQKARLAGLTTSADCVSDSNDRFGTLVKPALPHLDVLFANDYEAGKILGTCLRQPDGIRVSETEEAARALLELGVRDWVILHFPEAVHARSRDGTSLWHPSVRLEPGEIVNCAGAGDALAAGVLHGWHEGWSLSRAVELGVATAAVSLRHLTCTEGVLPLEETLAFAKSRGNSAAVQTRGGLRPS